MIRFSASQWWLAVLTGLVLWSTALLVRREVLAQQTRTVEGEVPFLLESALQFRMTRLVAEGQGLPQVEPSVQYPEGVETRKTYSIGAEYIYTFFARMLPSEWSLATRVRWVSAGLFCLTIPLAALWAGLRYRSWLAAWCAGLLLAVSPAFVVRSTGLELSRENLAFPFIAAFLVFECLSTRSEETRRRWIHAACAATSLALAQVFWDMSQYMIGLWIVLEWIRVARGGRKGVTNDECRMTNGFSSPGSQDSTPDTRHSSFFTRHSSLVTRHSSFFTRHSSFFTRHSSFFTRHSSFFTRHSALPLSLSLALTLAGLLNPYLRSKGFLFSPLMALVLARVLFLFVPAKMDRRFRWGAVALFFLLWQALGGLFVVNYSHFGELLWAKLRFLNVKPEDPGLLTYIQRIMWTPALNSSTWELTKAYFPITLWALLAAIAGLQWTKRRAEGADSSDVFYAAVTFPLYILFFRFHVFLILFAAGCIGGALARLFRQPRSTLRTVFAVLSLVFLTGVEAFHLLFFEPAEAKALRAQYDTRLNALRSMGFDVPDYIGNRWGRPGPGYNAVSQLTEELKALAATEPGPVLAGFGISGNILADAGLPILLHPKFETPGIRERVRQFYEQLFLRSEKEMRDWALTFLPRDENAPKAFYYVHGLGSLAGGDTRESPRYMVDALVPPPHAAVHVLENQPRNAVWFRPVGGNDKFRIFRIVTAEDLRMADEFVEQGRRALERGDLETARSRARRALLYHWKHEPAQQLLSRIGWRD
jgi:hypothetical protein